MTNEEFIELAKQNNALLTPEEAEKHRQEFAEFLERYQFNWDWMGSFYLTDRHDPLQRVVDGIHTGICVGGIIAIVPFLFFYGLFALVVLIFSASYLTLFSPEFFVIIAGFICGFIMLILKHRKSS